MPWPIGHLTAFCTAAFYVTDILTGYCLPFALCHQRPTRPRLTSPFVRSIGSVVKDQIRRSSPSAESRSDIAEADLVTDSQGLVFPAHNAREDRACYAITDIGAQRTEVNRSARAGMCAPTTRVGGQGGVRADVAIYTGSEKKFFGFPNP